MKNTNGNDNDISIINLIWIYKIEQLGFVSQGVFRAYYSTVLTFDFIVVYRSNAISGSGVHDLYYNSHKGSTKSITCQDLASVLKFLAARYWNMVHCN